MNLNTIDTQEIFVASNYEQIIESVCDELGIEDKNNIPPSQWDYILSCFYDEIIKPNRQLMYSDNPSTPQLYNIDIIEGYINLYIKLCKKYNQCVSVISFISMIDVSKNYLYQILGSKAPYLLQKLQNAAEQSHINRADNNPKAQTIHLAWLNKYADWNGSGTVAHKESTSALTAADLPQLTVENSPKID